MRVEWTEKTPRKIQRYAGADYPSENPDLVDVLTSADVDHVAEIFSLIGIRRLMSTGIGLGRRSSGLRR